MDHYNREASNYFEFQHEHQCPVPECGKLHLCFLMACRGGDHHIQPCWPCRLAGRAE